MMICMIMCSLISTLLHLSEKVCRFILLAARLSTCWPRQYNLIPVFYYPSLHQGVSKSFENRVREVVKKSKWKFKMAFAIRRPTPPRPPP